jgi:putative transposase
LATELPWTGFLVLSTIGRVALRWSCPLHGRPKTVTISHEADGWYACFSCEGLPIQPLAATGQETGIDLGLESFATLSDGSQIANPRIFRVAERALKRAQRWVFGASRAAAAAAAAAAKLCSCEPRHP